MSQKSAEITEREFLSLLGLPSKDGKICDLEHSMNWYKTSYPDLPDLIKNYISNCLTKYKCFPKEIETRNPDQVKYNYFQWILVEKDSFVHFSNDPDKGTIDSSNVYNDAAKLIDIFIAKSFNSGGSISTAWK